MGEFFDSLTLYERVFFVISMSSTLILLIQTILAIFGISSETDSDFDGGAVDTGVDIEAADADMGERAQGPIPDNGLRLFTVKGIMSFLMLGSWVGFLLSRAQVPEWIATIFALASGMVALVLMAKVMQGLMSLQQDGTLKVKNALGQTGQVYIRIPAQEKGMGKVNVTVQERLCEFDAVTEDSEMIKTGEMVYITDIRPGNIMVVERVKVEEK
jgi:membrane protein implicated in regulation of membrane protease activity